MNTSFGKVLLLMFPGWLIQSAGILMMFSFCSSKSHSIPVFLSCYMLYVIGYTFVNMTAQTLPALLTNGSRQRPTVGVWQTALNYITPMAPSWSIPGSCLPSAADLTSSF